MQRIKSNDFFRDGLFFVLQGVLDGLDSLNIFSFTFRSTRSQIIFKIGVLKIW